MGRLILDLGWSLFGAKLIHADLAGKRGGEAPAIGAGKRVRAKIRLLLVIWRYFWEQLRWALVIPV
jgi:hypothetical protein